MNFTFLKKETAGIDVIRFEGEFVLKHTTNWKMAGCIGMTYSISMMDGRLTAMDISENGKDFNTTSIESLTVNGGDVKFQTKNSMYEFVLV